MVISFIFRIVRIYIKSKNVHVNFIASLDSFRKYIQYPKYYIIVKPDFSLPFSLKDKLKKFTVEKETLESQLKNEKDEKELYKVSISILLLHDQNVDGVDLEPFSCIFFCVNSFTKVSSCFRQAPFVRTGHPIFVFIWFLQSFCNCVVVGSATELVVKPTVVSPWK